jgi:O-antigen/teichoic acid export membrane protein
MSAFDQAAAGTAVKLPSTTLVETPASRSRAVARGQIRGSSLLLLGRLLSRGTNFAVQIITVRYLSVGDFGAFAYALSIAHIAQTIATCGLDRAVTRFVPQYQERAEHDKLFGTLVMVTSVILSLGLAAALCLHVIAATSGSLLDDATAQAVLLILIFLVPLQALDDLIVGLFAVFAKPKAIFFRRHVLAPGLKLLVVLLLVFSGSTVLFLAAGYLMASVIGIAVYAVLLLRLMRAQGLLARWPGRRLQVPWREVLAFTFPLLMSDLVLAVMSSSAVLFLEHFRGLDAVAAYRAQQPVAAANQMVMASFATLFTPAASRLLARDDRDGVNDLYWTTAMWIAVLTFPIVALTCSLAGPTTRLLLGDRYADSAVLLTVLAGGYYFNAALGFNGLTLKIFGKLRYVVGISVVTMAVSLGANLLLVPPYGAFGAAVATCIALVAHNILKQAGLRLGTGIDLFQWRYLRGYLVILTGLIGLWMLHAVTDVPYYLSPATAALVSWVVFRCNRHLLDLEHTFPELRRIPFLRRVLGLS